MSATTSTDPIEQLFHHLAALKKYVQRVMVAGDALTQDEEDDKSLRLRELIQIGTSFDLTEKEIVIVLYRDLRA